MDKTPMIQRGARFYAADLHLHTPASHDYGDKKATAKDFVDTAIAAGLDVIAVTDHNSAEWVDLVREAAKKTSLAVLPGVEVSTPHCHILAIFDVKTPKTQIDDFLTRVGISTADRGKKEINSQPIEDVLKEIDNAGGLAIAAHANSSNGMLQQGSGQFKIKLCGDPRVAALEFTKQEHVESFRKGKIPGYPSKACVQGSDSHSLSTIGERRAFIKMDTPSLWGLRQALLDHEVRIRVQVERGRERAPARGRCGGQPGFLRRHSVRVPPVSELPGGWSRDRKIYGPRVNAVLLRRRVGGAGDRRRQLIEVGGATRRRWCRHRPIYGF
jgi:predicted metal-dependent phosphoesterase TrpH